MRPSTRAEGPTSGTTRQPSACAAATRAAPGSATPGQPASDSTPMSSSPRCAVDNRTLQASRVAGCGRMSMAIAAIGTSSARDFRKARAGLAFSTTKRRRRRARRDGSRRKHRFGWRPRREDSGRGRSCRTWRGRSRRRTRNARGLQHVGERGSAAGRSGRWDRRSPCAEEHDPQRLDLDAAGAVVGPLAPQVVVDRLGVRTRNVLRTSTRPPGSARRRVEERDAGMEDDRPAGETLAACAIAASPTRLAHGAAVAIGDLVGADDEGVGMVGGDARGLGRASRTAVCAGDSPGKGDSSVSRRHRPEGRPRRSSSVAPIARGRSEDQRPAGVACCFCAHF